MSKVIWHTTMSLDGFVAGPDDAMDWVFERGERSAVADLVMVSTGAILAGRRIYDMPAGVASEKGRPYGGRWSGPIFILTHRPPAEAADPAISFVSDGVENAVATALEAAAGKNVVIFGPTIARQAIEAGLLDEIVIHLVPVLLGDGVRLYGEPGAPTVELELTTVAEAGQQTDLRFRVVRS